MPFRHLVVRHLVFAELDLHMAPVGNALGILHRLPGIGKQSLHLLFALHIVLAALVAHPVLVRQLLAGLQAQQDIVRLCVLHIGIMHVVGGHQRDVQLLTHSQQRRIHRLLGGNPVILQLQEKVAPAETGFIPFRNLARLVDQPFLNIALHLPRQTGRQRDDALMKFLQHFHVHTGPVVIPFRETAADDLHQICVTCIVLRQQHQMIVSVFAAGQLPVKPGTGRHIDLTADDRIQTRCRRFFIKVDHAVHNAVVRDGCAVHTQLFDALDVFFDLVGTV